MKILITAACGLALDLLLGDPERLAPVHPVVLMGRAISRQEKWLRTVFPKTEQAERTAGCCLTVAMCLGTLFVTSAVLQILKRIWQPLWWVASILWCWQALALRDLKVEAMRVYRALHEGTLEEARKAVSRIVGRDTRFLDEAGVARAAVETVAENFSDGVAAPMLYMLLGGAPLALCYKAVNTMDSMLGYRNARYLHFGRAAAKLDDVANFIPARLAALLLIGAAGICGQDMKGAARIWKRDRRRHESPNAGQCEAVMAGALGLRLGGPAVYFGEKYDKPTLGDDRRGIVPEDIPAACRMEMVAGGLCFALLGIARTAVVLLF